MNREKYSWIYDVIFLLVLVLAGYLRLTGVDWGEGQHQHPDENHFTSVLESLRAHECADPGIPVEACPAEQKRWISIGDYFNSKTSTLNQYNRGFGFYVYGNLPMTMIRLAAEATNQTNLRLFGRQFSALADLFAILFLYFIVSRMYGRRVGLLASLFSALTVMQIQQSHFFTVDLFVNTFAFLAIWFAVEILNRDSKSEIREERLENQETRLETEEERLEVGDLSNLQPPREASNSPIIAKHPGGTNYLLHFFRNPLLLLSIGFGVAYGMALACKVNIYPLAILLPAAFIIRYFISQKETEDIGSNKVPLTTNYWLLITTCLIAGGLATLISFRIFQPYAFDGIGLNPQWIANIKEQRVQAQGDADLPWNLQWARRSHLYSFTNVTLWGLGLPLGILAWAGFLYMGWRILKGEWRHALLWGWTALYFLWQSLQFNPTMRYQLPIYPLLAMMAAWFVFELAGLRFRKSSPANEGVVEQPKRFNLATVFAGILGFTIIVLTAIWALAFQGIYLRPEPRIAASRWIYQNIPGPINLKIQQANASSYNQPLPFPTGVYIQPEEPYQTSFVAQNNGQLKEILLGHVAAAPDLLSTQLYLSIWQNPDDPQPLASTFTTASSEDGASSLAQVASFDQSPVLTANQTYYLKLETNVAERRVNICGSLNILIQAVDQTIEQVIDISAPCAVASDNPYTITFVPQTTGTLDKILLEQLTNVDSSGTSDTHTLSLFISKEPNTTAGEADASASLTGTFAPFDDLRGDSYTLVLDQPVEVAKGTQYYLRIETNSGVLTLKGASISNETDYDYGLPFRVDSYDAFSGIYRGDLNLQVYWDDNEEKLNRFVTTLDQTDYIFIPTNHQYAQITRLPERYPLTTLYYRELMGCPIGENIIRCYHEAKPGDYQGKLGFNLVEVFETFPTLGPIVINDQAAEEAFTFYDHPKVLIFKKSADFDSAKVQSILSQVDLTKVARLTPRQFDDYSNLLLSADKLAQQRAGGTWSELFSYDWLQNRYPVLGLVIWYFFVFILGLAIYPLIRLAMPGLADKGYPLSRALGLVLFGYLVWMAGSLGIPYTRTVIAIIFGAILLIGVVLAYYQRDELREEWKTKRKYFLMIEGIFLSFFLIDLLIRLGNSDLWHPAKGGERPMDFSYFNAILKSTSFPPYDPWFAGGYINYYYYGFVLVATPVKLLGIVPTIAYNFILPTLFAIVATSAFSLGWNLLAKDEGETVADDSLKTPHPSAFVAGISASLLTILLGNLGTIQLVFQRLQQLGALGEATTEASILQRWTWAFQGLLLTFKGSTLPIGFGDWYWNPSRVIPPGGGNEITEFPLFTFLYSDLHAHMIAMPLALLALSWALATVSGRAKWRNPLAAGLGFAVGGLIIGALYPVNLSDTYTYLLISIIAVVYSIWRYTEASSIFTRIALSVGAIIALVVLSQYMYEPYRAWYSQAYSALDPWKGPFTPIWSYLTHWTVFLFIVASWMAWETHEWMASTPISSLRKLKPYQLLIEGALVVFVLALLVLAYLKTSVGWIALPLAAWAGVLLLRPSMPDAKRFVLFMIGTALLITIVVEIVVVRGDIGRANTIFKFYLQAWILLAVSSGAAFAWTLPAFFKWLPGWRLFWQTAMILLISGAAMFTVSGTAGKIRDRWIVEAPRTIDAITFMNYAHYDDFGQRLDLSEDYRAIRWMQDNVQGSPVIVEANCPEYRWCSRYTIYTGLPGVVGWNFHQRQQRAFVPNWVTDRVDAITNFYTTTDTKFARDFLNLYDVRYIVVGQLERAEYKSEDVPNGLSKFEEFDGVYWHSVYSDGKTVIYEVIE
jgi:YYY domain-containing protein